MNFFCRIGWHKVVHDGYLLVGGGEGHCARCHGQGLIDSQGNLFGVRHPGDGQVGRT